MTTIADRDLRQRDIAAPEKLADTTAFVIGVGAIGRQVAMQLAAIGVGQLVLFDPDTVGPENLAVQGFFEADLNLTKIEAVGATCKALNSMIKVTSYAERFKRIHLADYNEPVVFCCVDTMESRKFIWESCKGRCEMFVDGRMAAEVCRVFTVRDRKDTYYETTLFSDEEAYQASCTAKTTLYCANVAAGFMVAQLTKMYRDIPYDRDVQINILANEMAYADHKNKAGAEAGAATS